MRQWKTICWTLILFLPPFILYFDAMPEYVRKCANTRTHNNNNNNDHFPIGIGWQNKAAAKRTCSQNNIYPNTNWLYAFYAQWFYVPRLWLNNCLEQIFLSLFHVAAAVASCLLLFPFDLFLSFLFNASILMKAHTVYITPMLCIRDIDADTVELETQNISTKNGYGNENKSNRLH